MVMQTSPYPAAVAAAHPSEATISWAAVFAGAAVAIAVSSLLTLLAAGFGLSLASGGLPSQSALAAFTPVFGAITVAIQVVSAGLGGYLAGRLRLIWRTIHVDEAHFRDTAHGLLTWAVSAIVGAVLSATVFTPYAERMAVAAASTAAAGAAPADAARAAAVAAQAAFFMGLGMLLSAFTAAVAARVGGQRSEEMHARFTP